MVAGQFVRLLRDETKIVEGRATGEEGGLLVVDHEGILSTAGARGDRHRELLVEFALERRNRLFAVG